jgi:predicted PurR-regulated permease PerM
MADGTHAWLRLHSNRVVATGVILAVLYLGRGVLIPLALAIMLSLLLAPLVRNLRRVGAGHMPSVLISVLVMTLSCAAASIMLGTQLVRVAEGLPRYEANVQRKLKIMDEAALGRVRLLTSEARRLMEGDASVVLVRQPVSADRPFTGIRAPGRVSQDPGALATQPLQLIGTVARSAWPLLQAAGIVLVVLIFLLLEHESLRDRVIRIAGLTDIRATTLALNDAGERLSRYFVSQFAVNLIFGLTIWAVLSVLRVPNAMLCGTLAGLLRFVPYVGVAVSGLFAAALAFAVDAGWSMAVSTLGAFVALDIIMGQLIEPRIYGHATGLSPLSVVVAAIFWSALWGPVGLFLSTPLTLCLLVAGRHVKALRFLEFLLGDVQPLTMAQKFYQRALSGDPHEIVSNARVFLRREPLVAYWDRVLLPALHLARLDGESGATTEQQQAKMHSVVIEVIAALMRSSLEQPRVREPSSVLHATTAGTWLRQQRERLSGRWQGPLDAAAGSVVICSGVGTAADDLAAELLVRLLRGQSADARHFSPAEIEAGPPAGADPAGISLVYLVSAFPSSDRERAEAIAQKVHAHAPRASVICVRCPGVSYQSESASEREYNELTASSLSQAVQLWEFSREAPRADIHSRPAGAAGYLEPPRVTAGRSLPEAS